MRPFWEASWGHVGVHVGLMLASFFVMIFDAVRTSFWIPTWSEIEAKIEPKTFPKTFKFRNLTSMPNMIENEFHFDQTVFDFRGGVDDF